MVAFQLFLSAVAVGPISSCALTIDSNPIQASKSLHGDVRCLVSQSTLCLIAQAVHYRHGPFYDIGDSPCVCCDASECLLCEAHTPLGQATALWHSICSLRWDEVAFGASNSSMLWEHQENWHLQDKQQIHGTGCLQGTFTMTVVNPNIDTWSDDSLFTLLVSTISPTAPRFGGGRGSAP